MREKKQGEKRKKKRKNSGKGKEKQRKREGKERQVWPKKFTKSKSMFRESVCVAKKCMLVRV